MMSANAPNPNASFDRPRRHLGAGSACKVSGRPRSLTVRVLPLNKQGLPYLHIGETILADTSALGGWNWNAALETGHFYLLNCLLGLYHLPQTPAIPTARAVREVTPITLCNPLREVTAGGARAVRAVKAQLFDFIAGGNSKSAAARALYTTYIPGRRLLARRAPVMDGYMAGRMGALA